MNFKGWTHWGCADVSCTPPKLDQVTSSGVVAILTFTSNLIKSRINKGVSLMEIYDAE